MSWERGSVANGDRAKYEWKTANKKKTSNPLPPPTYLPTPKSVTGHSSSDLIRFKLSQHLSEMIGYFFRLGNCRYSDMKLVHLNVIKSSILLSRFITPELCEMRLD